jgi:hypothetical protein
LSLYVFAPGFYGNVLDEEEFESRAEVGQRWGNVAGNRIWFCFSTDLEVEIHFVASSMEAWIRGSQAEVVGVVDKRMTETLRRKAQGLKMDPYIALC